MPLFYADQHICCSEYAAKGSAVVKYQEYEQAQTLEVEHSTIFLVEQGDAIMDCDTTLNIDVTQGDIFLAPSGSQIRLNTQNKLGLISVIFMDKIMSCNKYSISELIKVKEIQADIGIKILRSKSVITKFCKLAKDTLSDGLACIHYQKMLVNELIFFLRAYYTDDELYEFFYPIISKDLNFKDLVLSFGRDVSSVSMLAERAKMSLSTFNKKFKEEFGTTASEWLANKRAQRLYVDISVSDLSLSDVSKKHHFTTQAYMTTFCKAHFGDTPQSIRDKVCISSPVRIRCKVE